MRVRQISVFLENKAGRLAEVTRALGEAGINIRALAIADTSDFGILRMIVDDPERGLEVLKGAGFAAREADVLAVEVPDRPGGLASVLRHLAEEGINVEYLYAFVEKSGDNAVVILRTEDLDKTVQVLEAAGVTVLPPGRVYRL